MMRAQVFALAALAAVACAACLEDGYGTDQRCYRGEQCDAGHPTDSGTHEADAGLDAGGEEDAGVDAGCVDVPIAAPAFSAAASAYIAGLDSVADTAATWSSGAERLCYFSDRNASPGIYCKHYDQDGGIDFGEAAVKQTSLSALDAGLIATEPSLSADGTTLYFAVQDTAGTQSRLFAGTWSAAGGYGAGGIQELDVGVANPFAPEISPDDNELFFAADAGSGQSALWVARRIADGGFGNAEPLTSLNAAGASSHPAISEDGRWLAFETNRTGAWRVFVSQRVCATWLAPEQVTGDPQSDAPSRPDWGPRGSLLLTCCGGIEDIRVYPRSGN